jgi:ankyrin repeat protein
MSHKKNIAGLFLMIFHMNLMADGGDNKRFFIDLIQEENVAEINRLIIDDNNLIYRLETDGMAPLWFAVYYDARGYYGDDSIEIIKILLDAGADPNENPFYENYAYIWLEAGGDYEGIVWSLYGSPISLMFTRNLAVAELLVKYGANIDKQDEYGRTALMYHSFLYGDDRIASYLIENGANINITNNTGQTALFYAAYFGQIKNLELLVKNGADLNTRDRNGHTALMIASCSDWIYRRDELRTILLNAGAIETLNDKNEVERLKEEWVGAFDDFLGWNDLVR